MLELLNHMGFVPRNDPTASTTLHMACAVVLLLFLVALAVVYLVISAVCSALSYGFPEASLTCKRKACVMFWDVCIYMMGRNQIEFQVTGDAITSESCVFISNHQALADHLAVNYLARHSYLANSDLEVPMVNFFTWFLSWRVPTLRILVNMAKNDENWELDSLLCECFFRKLLDSRKTEWLVVFPEVNIFTEQSRNLQQIQSDKFYLPVFNWVLYPRFSAFYNVMSMVKHNSYKFRKLYDLTIFYYYINEFNETVHFSPTLLETFSFEYKIYVNIHVKFKHFARVSGNRSKMEKWLEKTWMEKDQMMTGVRMVQG